MVSQEFLRNISYAARPGTCTTMMCSRTLSQKRAEAERMRPADRLEARGHSPRLLDAHNVGGVVQSLQEPLLHNMPVGGTCHRRDKPPEFQVAMERYLWELHMNSVGSPSAPSYSGGLSPTCNVLIDELSHAAPAALALHSPGALGTLLHSRSVVSGYPLPSPHSATQHIGALIQNRPVVKIMNGRGVGDVRVVNTQDVFQGAVGQADRLRSARV